MNEANHQTIEYSHQSEFLTHELERLWLLSAIREGLSQIEAGHTVVATEDFFDTLNDRINKIASTIKA